MIITYMSPRYFGRAKELPGVKELFESRKKEEDEETATEKFYKRFTDRGPSYFGDEDEADVELVTFERKAEADGWNAQWDAVRELVGLPEDTPAPPMPQTSIPESDALAKTGDVAMDGTDLADVAAAHARAAAAFIPFLSAEYLMPPKMPGKEQMEAFLLDLQKRALVEEYFGN